jgi:Ca2+-binding RTX toxin-like protein
MANKSSTKNKSTLAGTSAADVLTVKHDQVTVTGAGGNDTIKITKGNSSKVSGGAGADTITVSVGKSHTIHGDAGNDTITIGKSGGTGIKVYGDAGNDIIKATNSYAVTFYGGDGNDTLTGGKGADKLYGDAGTDKLYGGAGNDTLSGGAGNDTLNGQAGNDTLTGGAGKDTFVYANGGGSDKITDYTAGSDTLQISSGSISKTALANSSKDLVFTVGSGKVTLSNAAAKTISLKDSRGSYTASKTAITLGSSFSGTMDVAKYLGTVTTVNGKSTTKTVTVKGNAKANTIYGGSGANTIYGYVGNDKLYGYAGADKLYGGDGDDTLYGGTGNDTLFGGAGNDILYGDTGNDTFYGDEGNDTFHYTSGTSVIKDFAAGETLAVANAVTGVGVNGEDIVLKAGTGSLTVTGGKGKLTEITEAGRQKGFYIDDEGEGAFEGSAGDDIIAVARYIGMGYGVYGGKGNDSLIITDKAVGAYVYGDDGDDTIYINGGRSYLYGGSDLGIDANPDYTSNNNTFVYSSGTATIGDFKETDTLKFESAITGVSIRQYRTSTDIFDPSAPLEVHDRITLTAGTNGSLTVEEAIGKLTSLTENGKAVSLPVITQDDTNTTASIAMNESFANRPLSVEMCSQNVNIDASSVGTGVTVSVSSATGQSVTVTGSTGNDTITVNGYGSGSLSGGAGSDTLYGGNGNDYLYGDEDNDTLYGGNGNDWLSGGDGADTIYSGRGNDVIFAGSGKDKIYVGAGDNVLFGGAGTEFYIPGWYVGTTIYGTPITSGSFIPYNSDSMQDDFIFSAESAGTNTIHSFESDYDRIYFSDDTRVSRITTETSTTQGGESRTNIVIKLSNEGTIILSDFDADNAIRFYGIREDGTRGDYNLTVGVNRIGELYGTAGDDILEGDGANNKLYGYAGNDTLKGNAGNDTLYGGAGNDTLTGGGGSDEFVYEGGNDTITDYSNYGSGSAQDKLIIENNTVIGAKYEIDAGHNSRHIILTVKNSDGSIKLNNVADDTYILVTDERGSYALRMFEEGTEPYISLGSNIQGRTFSGNVFDASEMTFETDDDRGIWMLDIDASGATSRIGEIRGSNSVWTYIAGCNVYNEDNYNYLVAGNAGGGLNGGSGKDYLVGNTGGDQLWGNEGDDYLIGGAGDDEFYGGDGNDVFAFGEGGIISGTKTIYDYEVGDIIKFESNCAYTGSVDGNNVELNFSDVGKIIILDGKGMSITLQDCNGQNSTRVFP